MSALPVKALPNITIYNSLYLPVTYASKADLRTFLAGMKRGIQVTITSFRWRIL